MLSNLRIPVAGAISSFRRAGVGDLNVIIRRQTRYADLMDNTRRGSMTRDTRRVKHPIRAWRADVSEDVEHLPQGRLMAIGEPIMIEPMEEIHILRWPTDPEELAIPPTP